ncbi:MAG: hypothetical protein D6741_14025, partial [Planctomycetota bacterium]
EGRPAPEGPAPAAVPEFPEARFETRPPAVIVSDATSTEEDAGQEEVPTGTGLFREERPHPLRRLFENLRPPASETRSAFVPLSPLG